MRQAFLDVALQQFLEKGYSGASIEGISRLAKVSKNTVYLQYKTKEALFLAAAERGLEKVDLGIDAKFNSSSVEEGLLEIIHRIQNFAADPMLRNLARLLIAESQRFPSIASDQFARFKLMIKPVADYIARAADAGCLSVADAEAAAADLVILVLGGFSFLLSEPGSTRQEREKRAKEVRTLLLQGWKAQ